MSLEKKFKKYLNIAKNNKIITSSMGSKSNNANSNDITFSQFIAGLVTLN